MYKNKEVNVAEELTEILNNMNFNLPDKRMELIDLKLNTLLNNMEYKDYITFIKSDEKLKLYDYLLGKYSNNDTLSKMLVKSFDNDLYEYLNKIIDIKLKGLNLKLKKLSPSERVCKEICVNEISP